MATGGILHGYRLYPECSMGQYHQLQASIEQLEGASLETYQRALSNHQGQQGPSIPMSRSITGPLWASTDAYFPSTGADRLPNRSLTLNYSSCMASLQARSLRPTRSILEGTGNKEEAHPLTPSDLPTPPTSSPPLPQAPHRAARFQKYSHTPGSHPMKSQSPAAPPLLQARMSAKPMRRRLAS